MYLAAMPDTARTRPAPHAGAAPARHTRLLAVLLDFAIYLAFQAALALIAVAVFMVQTDGGARDLSSSGATVGWAIGAAAVPAWLGLLARDLVEGSATPGQRRNGLRVEGHLPRRLARLLMHPVAALGWGWLAVVAALATLPGLPLFLAAAAVTVIVAGLVSAAMIAINARALPLHDRIAGTRLLADLEAGR